MKKWSNENTLSNIASSLAVIFGLISVILQTSYFKNLGEKYSLFYLVMAGTLIGSVLIFIPGIVKFLTNDSVKLEKSSSSRNLTEKYYNSELELLSKIRELLIKNPEVLNVGEAVYAKVASDIEDSIIKKIDDKFSASMERQLNFESIGDEMRPLLTNTSTYINRVQRNSVVNLLIGILGTIAAISVLAFSVLSNQSFENINVFLMHFLPRLTFVLFIQLFAFFFLRLYKSNLEDAKYFQNELTNLNAKSSALRIAYLTGKEQKVEEILKEFASIERNFKLLKDETLFNIEKAKIEKDMDTNLLSSMKELLSKYTDKKT